MEIELLSRLSARKETLWKKLLAQVELEADTRWDSTVLIWEDGELAAAGSRRENLLKCIAVDPRFQGQGMTAALLTRLRQDAFGHGFNHLFLYTKPKNRFQFSSLFFYPVAQTEQVLLMEDRRDGIKSFLSGLPAAAVSGTVGAAVMNCNPFTRGHRYLIETAARDCGHLYVFILSEDKSRFSAEDRMAMARAGTADLPNVTVLPTGPYLISSATFPTYFLKDRDSAPQAQCLLDIEVFLRHYATHFRITRRYVGTEPLSPLTALYNEALKTHLPGRGVDVVEIPRLETADTPISASRVRKALEERDAETLRLLLPDTTLSIMEQRGLL